MSKLIDADKLITDMNTRAEEEYLEFRDIRNMVEYAPTIHAIPVDKVKKAREEMEKQINEVRKEHNYGADAVYGGHVIDGINLALKILDKLIAESEDKNERK